MSKLLRSQSGQVLPFFIVAGTVLLAVIANLSLRNLSSGFRSTTLDTSSRVTAAAEGGLERFLSYGYDGLAAKATECPPGNTEESCKVVFSGSQDNISAQALVSVESYGSTSSFRFDIEKDVVSEVNLDTADLAEPFGKNNLYLCWSGDSDIYYIAYGSSNPIREYVCRSGASCAANVSGTHATASSSISQCPMPAGVTYTNQYHIKDLKDITDIKGLRVRAVGGSGGVAEAMVYASDGKSLPIQGYEITSRGEISDTGDVQSQVTETKTVRVSYPYLPAYFDFGLFAEEGFGN